MCFPTSQAIAPRPKAPAFPLRNPITLLPTLETEVGILSLLVLVPDPEPTTFGL